MDNTPILSRKQIQPLTGTNHTLEVVDPIKGYFIVVRASDGQQSDIFTDTMGEDFLLVAYECFKIAYTQDKKIFNNLCNSTINQGKKT